MDLRVSIVGFGVGLLVGLTGMGGGAVMTPMLILLGWARPVIAVGTDLAWGTVTKAVGAFVHYHQRTIEITIVRRLAMGSIPGALAGLALLAHLRTRGGDIMDRVVVRMLGIALVCVALSLLVRCLRGPREPVASEAAGFKGPVWLTTLIGACIGFLVSMTSVGSGSMIVACLVVVYPRMPLRRIVGSDIAHALFLVGVSFIGHLKIGGIDQRLLAGLLVGSIPGVWIGSRMGAVFPEKVLRPVLATTLLCLGYKLL
jgi:uncharacterized protein